MNNTTWALDAAHSEVLFKVRHLMISNVSGQFRQFSGTVSTHDQDIATAQVHFEAEIDSISTNNDQRDAHLKNTDFFDAGTHPKLTFDSTRIDKTGEQEYKLTGNLTMRGVTKEISLNVEFGGVMQDPWGNTRAGFTVAGKVNRKDFGVSFGAVSETGGVMLGEEVAVTANVEFVQAKEMQPA